MLLSFSGLWRALLDALMRILFKEETNLATDFVESAAENEVPPASGHAAKVMLHSTNFFKDDG